MFLLQLTDLMKIRRKLLLKQIMLKEVDLMFVVDKKLRSMSQNRRIPRSYKPLLNNLSQ
jgi:hypothetical protein